MSAKWFVCPDGNEIEIAKCLKTCGCRMGSRCATVPYLKLVGYDRDYRGVTPSAAGTGARQIYLKATTDYAIDPNDRAFAALGTGVHGKLGMQKYIHNVLSEERLRDEECVGIADCLEDDEQTPGKYILSDYKTSGSFAIAKWLGLQMVDTPVTDDNGEPVCFKSGAKKGEQKTKKVLVQGEPDVHDTAMQLNRYRIFFESYGFPISEMRVQAIPRDGNTYVAKNRGIDRNIILIPIPKIDDDTVLEYYRTKQAQVDEAFKTGWVERCTDDESWGGRRCESYCDVAEACRWMDKQHAA